MLKHLLTDESGATAIEYGLIAALVSVAAIGALTAMGTSLETMFNTVSDKLNEAVTSSQDSGSGGGGGGGGGGGTP